MPLSLTTKAFRTYVTGDLVGVGVGGAVTKVIAIVCRMMTGAGFGENTRGALITRGIAGMKAQAESLGGRAETLSGLSGVGSLSLARSGESTRSMSLGPQVGARRLFRWPSRGRRGRALRAVRDRYGVAAGVPMPVCETIRTVLHGRANLGQGCAALRARPIETEPRVMDLAFDHPASDTAVMQLAERIS